jgi:hypothetical protein
LVLGCPVLAMQSILLLLGGIGVILVSVGWCLRALVVREDDHLGWQPPDWALKFLTLSGNRSAWNTRLRVVNFIFGLLGVLVGALLISHA